MTVNEFLVKWNGRYIDVDRAYGSQCWDLAAQYAKEVVGCPAMPTGNGYAEGIFRFFLPPLPQYFVKVVGGYMPGDLIVWDKGWYPPAGHVALCIGFDGRTLTVMEQDGSKDFNHNGTADGVAYVTTRGLAHVAGALRPKGAKGMATISDAEYNDLKSWKAQGMLLMKERDENLYPYVNDISDALGIPRRVDKGLALLAIKQFKDAASNPSTVNRDTVIPYINKNLQ